MFLGRTTLTLDAKGRIAIPARYREQLLEMCVGKMVVSINPLDNCLPIYPYNEWENCVQAMDKVEDQTDEFRQFQRYLFSFSFEVDMDSNGRLLIPQASREEVGLEKSAVLIGHGEKFELWDEDNWLQTSKQDSEKLIESLKARTERMHIGFKL